jgi:NAD(P) transhydrogenase
MSESVHYDILVIGSGPAGQKAAIQGAKAGKRVALFERESALGGSCVHHGTIPSKTLRESALQMDRLRPTTQALDVRLRDDLKVANLMTRLDQVIHAHAKFMESQIVRNGITRYHGCARFMSDHEIQLRGVDRSTKKFTGDLIVIASGSHPRTPDTIPVDHEHILDSDSILSLIYLPKSLTVLGGGVIASEYASIFSLLGVQVTMIDQGDRPVRFLDPEITERFVQAFEENGGIYRGGQKINEVKWDGLSNVLTTLEQGEVIQSEKMLVALGRMANLEDLNIEAAGLTPTSRGVLSVDEHCRTKISHIYAVGDVIGPPSLASCSMEQGRRAVCHALGLDPGMSPETIPMGIFTIPEMASVGLSESETVSKYGGTLVGRASFNEIARGQISGLTVGLLKMVADPKGKQLLGVQIVGEAATELIHLGQMGLLNNMEVDSFVENIFNFPTMAEAYRVAALDIAKQRVGEGKA